MIEKVIGRQKSISIVKWTQIRLSLEIESYFYRLCTQPNYTCAQNKQIHASLRYRNN